VTVALLQNNTSSIRHPRTIHWDEVTHVTVRQHGLHGDPSEGTTWHT